MIKDISQNQTLPSHIHLIGIGGAGMSAIARVLLGKGYQVSGSDMKASALTTQLEQEGASVYIGHHATQIDHADWVVVSSAVAENNVERQAAQDRGIPVLKRSEFLSQLLGQERTVVAIAGSHGKTTTTGMLATIFLNAGQDPSFIVGGQIAHLGTNARAGQGPFIIEADEYDRTFLGIKPTIAVVTNVEHDHPDCYPTQSEFRAAFEAFVDLLSPKGTLVICADDPEAQTLGMRYKAQGGIVVGYGLTKREPRNRLPYPYWRAVDIQPNSAGGYDYVVLCHKEQELLQGLIRLRIPGTHNVLNSLAALIVADALDVTFGDASQALRSFRGMERRFEIKGVADGVTVIDDYAHHPTEIRATLAAANANYPERQIWAIWQPHTFTRTKALLEDFARAFREADHVIITPIYPAREVDDLGVSSADVAARMQGNDVRLTTDLEQTVSMLQSEVKTGDVVLTLGAGDGYIVGEKLLSRLNERH